MYFPFYFPVCGVSFVRNCVNELFLKALAMSLGLMCVLFLNVMELLSCCVGSLSARPCIVFQ